MMQRLVMERKRGDELAALTLWLLENASVSESVQRQTLERLSRLQENLDYLPLERQIDLARAGRLRQKIQSA